MLSCGNVINGVDNSAVLFTVVSFLLYTTVEVEATWVVDYTIHPRATNSGVAEED